MASHSVFVTGGSGFVGGALIRRLAGSGAEVRALARSPKAEAAVTAAGATAVPGELDDVEAMTRAAEGCDRAFHLAAYTGPHGTAEVFEKVNVAGTRNVLTACRRAGVRRFVHCSTEAVLMAGKPLVHADETWPLQPTSPAPYPATKAKAEIEVNAAAADGYDTVIVRPRMVWGPDDQTLLPTLADAVRSGKFAWIGGGRQLTDTTHVDNVVEGLLLAAERGKPGETYFVTDGEPIVFRDFATALLATQGLQAPARSIPKAVAAATGTAASRLWRHLPLPGDPPLTPFMYWAASQECTIDITKARTELGYRPVISRADGLEALRGE